MAARALVSLVILILAGAITGLLSVLAPYVVAGAKLSIASDPIYRLVGDAWDKFNLISIALLLLIGGILGFIRPNHWVILGLSTVIGFPCMAIWEMSVDPTSRNLWPIEFVLYAALIAGPTLLGANVGASLKRKDRQATKS